VAAKTVTTVSTDGLSQLVQADYDGNGTYEHTENWKQLVDGSQIATMTDVNAGSAVVARGLETISADGVQRRVEGLTVLDYPMPRGSVAGYYPELNPLLPLEHHDKISGTPAAKSIPVRVVGS